MYIFKIGNYETPSLCAETERLLCKRLEACSRETLPKVWKLTDAANAYAANGPGREKRAVRYRVYGGILLALGIFVLVPGLMKPQSPALIAAGAAALLAGAVEFALAGKRKAAQPPKSAAKTQKKCSKIFAPRILSRILRKLPLTTPKLRFVRTARSSKSLTKA